MPWAKGKAAWNKGIPSGPRPKIPDEVAFVENSTLARHSIKQRIIRQNLLPYECSICGMPPIWREQPMSLILDHINGINNDNRLENLRFVCHNCDSQLPTYKSRNRKSRRGGRVADGSTLEK